MFATIRKYKTDSVMEVARRVNEEFLPIISNVPGFIAYYAIDTGEGTVASISIFDSTNGAEESNKRAASWIKENIETLVKKPEIMMGEIMAQTTSEPGRVM